MILAAGSIIGCDAIGDKRSDTTGAGDAFAAGFLFGLLHRKSIEECARTANTLAGRIVAVDGCNFDAVEPEAFRSVLLSR